MPAAAMLLNRIPLPAAGPDAARARLMRLERLLDNLVPLPGGGGIGLDPLLGLVPVAGNAVTTALGLYMVWEARNLGVSRGRLAAMTARVGLDAAIGAIPFVGPAADFLYRSNSRNLKRVLR